MTCHPVTHIHTQRNNPHPPLTSQMSRVCPPRTTLDSPCPKPDHLPGRCAHWVLLSLHCRCELTQTTICFISSELNVHSTSIACSSYTQRVATQHNITIVVCDYYDYLWAMRRLVVIRFCCVVLCARCAYANGNGILSLVCSIMVRRTTHEGDVTSHCNIYVRYHYMVCRVQMCVSIVWLSVMQIRPQWRYSVHRSKNLSCRVNHIYKRKCVRAKSNLIIFSK